MCIPVWVVWLYAAVSRIWTDLVTRLHSKHGKQRLCIIDLTSAMYLS